MPRTCTYIQHTLEKNPGSLPIEACEVPNQSPNGPQEAFPYNGLLHFGPFGVQASGEALGLLWALLGRFLIGSVLWNLRGDLRGGRAAKP